MKNKIELINKDILNLMLKGNKIIIDTESEDKMMYVTDTYQVWYIPKDKWMLTTDDEKIKHLKIKSLLDGMYVKAQLSENLKITGDSQYYEFTSDLGNTYVNKIYLKDIKIWECTYETNKNMTKIYYNGNFIKAVMNVKFYD